MSTETLIEDLDNQYHDFELQNLPYEPRAHPENDKGCTTPNISEEVSHLQEIPSTPPELPLV